jgi:hypothetical protein
MMMMMMMMSTGSTMGCKWNVPHNLDSTRAYVSGSLWYGFGKGDGTFSDGPYGIQEPASFFDPDFYAWAFNPEVLLFSDRVHPDAIIHA